MRVGAEQDVRQFVLFGTDGQLVLMAMDFAPSVRPNVSIANGTVMMACFLRLTGAGLVEPTGLGNAHPRPSLVAGKELQQRNLQG